jgi:hypothetical protein
MQYKFKDKGIQKIMKDRQYNSLKKKDNMTNNTTAQRKRTKGQTIQQPKEKGQKDKQYNIPKKKDKRTNNTTA